MLKRFNFKKEAKVKQEDIIEETRTISEGVKLDSFTKIILLVIAINLTCNTFGRVELTSKVYAGEVENSIVPFNSQYGLLPLDSEGRVKVSGEIDINISKIGGWGVSSTGIPVQVK